MLLLLCALLGLICCYMVWSCDRDLRALRDRFDGLEYSARNHYNRLNRFDTVIVSIQERLNERDANTARYIEERVRPSFERIDAELKSLRRSIDWLNELANATSQRSDAYRKQLDILIDEGMKQRKLILTYAQLLATLTQRVETLRKGDDAAR